VNVNLLIDAIVRQTTVLVAQLATAAGARAPLAHTANQVFMDLVSELKADLLQRFRGDDEATVRGVLKDLVDSGVLFRTGRGDLTTYRVATAEETPSAGRDAAERIASFVGIAVHRYAPVTRTELSEHVPAGTDALDAALARLIQEGRIASEERERRRGAQL